MNYNNASGTSGSSESAPSASPSFLEDQIQETSACLLTERKAKKSQTQEEEEEEEYVRQLAASFAPALEELDALLASPGMELAAHVERLQRQRQQQQPKPQKLTYTAAAAGTGSSGSTAGKSPRNPSQNSNEYTNAYSDDEYGSDGSFDDELQNLATSEQLLRQELEFAHDFGAMMNTPITIMSKDKGSESDYNQHRSFLDPPQVIPMPSLLDDDESQEHPSFDQSQEQQTNRDSSMFTDETHFDNVHHVSGTEIEALDSHHDEGIEHFSSSLPDLDEDHYVSQQKRGDETAPHTPPTRSAITNPQTPVSQTRHNYTLSDHSHYLQIQTENRGGWYYMPILDLDPTVKEYIIPLPEKELDRLYVGFYAEDENDEDSQIVPHGLPIRTVGIKIRPDVLVGAVMDAIMHALEDVCEVQKRQGGHLVLTTISTTTPTNASSDRALDLDFQLVSYKGTQGSRFCERTLIMRIFYASNQSRQYNDKEPPLFLSQNSDDDQGLDGNADISETASVKLKEAAALVQKMETSKQGASERIFGSGFWGSKPIYPTKQAMQEAIAVQLLKKYKPCPSVEEGHLTLPSLSNEDWPWVLYSHRFIAAIWAEFQERDLSYASLSVCSFGQFPALTTLDVHYCSQLRRLSREVMVVSLLRSASELEQYAREAEYACANLIQVLKPCFELYKMDPPGLPQPLPLAEYPLDFTPHQDICPPWGQKVMEAMNGVTAISSDSSGEKSFDRAEKAVQLVLDAFQRQHDEEQSARLGRKNMQVMDRLAKMQAHKQTSIDKLQQAYTKSAAAKKAADEFHRFALKASSDLPETEQVPLFKCSILVGSSTGSVYVTGTQMMCVTQFIPIVGGNTVVLLDLAGLEFAVQDASSSLLNPLPAGISVRRGGSEIILFRPSYAAPRLVVFLEIVQALGGPHPKHHVGSSSKHHAASDEFNDNNESRLTNHLYGDKSPVDSRKHASGSSS